MFIQFKRLRNGRDLRQKNFPNARNNSNIQILLRNSYRIYLMSYKLCNKFITYIIDFNNYKYLL